jgi:hypothetical protein
MNKIYKIKVGIEEFEVSENDIPRIVEAMKSGDMVQLHCGLFRGNAILALCRDFDKEMETSLLECPKKSQEQIEEESNEAKLKDNRLKCELCKHTGWREGVRQDGTTAMFPCECQVLNKIL